VCYHAQRGISDSRQSRTERASIVRSLFTVRSCGWSWLFGGSERRSDDVRSTRHLVALAISFVLGTDDVEPLASHRLQLSIHTYHIHTPHTYTHSHGWFQRMYDMYFIFEDKRRFTLVRQRRKIKTRRPHNGGTRRVAGKKKS